MPCVFTMQFGASLLNGLGCFFYRLETAQMFTETIYSYVGYVLSCVFLKKHTLITRFITARLINFG